MAVLVVMVLKGAAPVKAVALVRIMVGVDKAMVQEVRGVRCPQVEGQ